MLNLEKADLLRTESSSSCDREERAFIGQFLTPAPIAAFMASLFDDYSKDVRLLDPGCGVGSLFSASVDEFLYRKKRIKSLDLTTYEVDDSLFKYLNQTIDNCKETLGEKGISFAHQNLHQDFILSDRSDLVSNKKYTHIIMNPPYKKINTDSDHRRALKDSINLETTNLYTGFLGLAIEMLEEDGELVAIVPRSFCNGTYYLPFRKFLLDRVAIKKIHLFESRKVFKDDDVLQENIIIHCKKEKLRNDIIITASPSADFYRDKKTKKYTASNLTQHIVKYSDVVKDSDGQKFIHIPTKNTGKSVIDSISHFPSTLNDLEVQVSTGPIVDFRLRDCLSQSYEKDFTVPLLYCCNLKGLVEWPKNTNKPNAIKISEDSQRWLWPNNGYYLLVKRFSSKEEKKRIVATFYNSFLPEKFIGFENKLNVFHFKKSGIENENLVKGLYIYLNSSLLDRYYRNFSGHTQVNATDLRSLKYPLKESLVNIGKRVKDFSINQEEIDGILDEEIGSMATAFS